MNEKHLNILVVDDDQDIRRLIQRLLSKKGHHVTLAVDGLSALEKVQEKHFDIIFTDLQMPEMNGEQLIEELRMLNPDIPVVIITGLNNSAEVSRLKSSVKWIIYKPFQIEDINGALDVTN